MINLNAKQVHLVATFLNHKVEQRVLREADDVQPFDIMIVKDMIKSRMYLMFKINPVKFIMDLKNQEI